MKLAEALRLRRDYSTRIEDLKSRIRENCKVQEGDEPAEDPMALLRELKVVDFKLAILITKINLVNSFVTLEIPSSLFEENKWYNNNTYPKDQKLEDYIDKESTDVLLRKTMCEALTERDSLKRRIEVMDAAIRAGSILGSFNYSKLEIKIVSTVDLAELQMFKDRLSAAMRNLDLIIQEGNWKYDFEETLEKVTQHQKKREASKRFYFF
jgi:hypothetical protein